MRWYEQMSDPEYMNKMIYKFEKHIPAIVQQVLEELGFLEWDATVHEDDVWNIFWKSQRPSLGEFRRAASYQKLIHIPKTGLICSKDNLARLLKKMK